MISLLFSFEVVISMIIFLLLKHTHKKHIHTHKKKKQSIFFEYVFYITLVDKNPYW